MDLGLNGKTVVVSGGAKGIGAAVTALLIEEGANVVVLDKDVVSGEVMAERYGKQLRFIETDLSDEKSCIEAVEKIRSTKGLIYGIVNNAGRNDGIGLKGGTYQQFLRSIESNCGHYFLLVQLLLDDLKKSEGSIVNISSKTALTGQGGTSGYVAAKGAILSLTREWAAELAPDNIRVNAVVPAEVWTPLYESWLNTFPNPVEKKKEIENRIPLHHRMTTPQEIANTVVFLLSARSAHTTGQWIHVDGGYVHLDRSLT